MDEIRETLRSIIENPSHLTQFTVENMTPVTVVKNLKEEEPVTLPEGLETVPFELVDEANAEQVETMFLAMVEDTHEFRSAVNIGKDVRTVIYEKGKKYGGTPIQVTTVSKEMAWSLQQTIDWCLLKQIKVVAVRRKGAIVEVGYIKKGFAEPPMKETYIHYFEKTDGWTMEKHERRR